jgi:MFS transporter, DHA3 family, macrolide efflux protein
MRGFLIIWLGELISMLGSGLTGFALGVWIYQETGLATPFALTVLFGSLPRIILSPFAGSIADRWNRRWIMILADTGSALVTLLAYFLLQENDLQIWMIYLISICYSIFGAFQEPAYTASITMLVPKKDLARASGLGSLGQALEALLTPVAAGFLFVTIGLRGIILIDFLTFFFAIGALLLVPIPQPEYRRPGEAAESAFPESPQPPIQPKASLWADAVFGWRYLRSRSGLFILLWFYALVNFFLNFSMVLLGPMVLSQHSAREYGLVQMFIGAGTLAGSLVLSAWGGPKGRKIPTVIGFITLCSAGLLVAGISSYVFLIGAGLFLMLFSVPIASGSSQVIFQSKVAPDVQGRVFAIRSMISRSVTPLAFALAGPLADRLLEPLMAAQGALGQSLLGSLFGSGPGRGIGVGFVFSGLCLLVACAWAYANPRLRLLEDELPDEI